LLAVLTASAAIVRAQEPLQYPPPPEEPNARQKAAQPPPINLDKAMLEATSADVIERRQGASDLGWLRVKAASGTLVGMLLNDPDSSVRQAAAVSLAMVGARSAAPELIKALQDKDKAVRLSSIESLGILKAASAVGDLIKLLEGPDPAAARASAMALGLIGSPKAAGTLKAALQNHDADVRVEAAVALGRLGDASGLPAARMLLTSAKASWVRMQAAYAISLAGTPNDLGLLGTAILAEKDPAVRRAIRQAQKTLQAKTATSAP
jgi:HEAT repeat protein